MSEGKVSKKSKDLGSRLLSLKNQQKFCDATIVVNGKRVPVHAVVLAASSDFFESAFEMSDSDSKEVTFNDVNTDILESIIDCCYTSNFKITKENAIELLTVANVLSMSEIIEIESGVLKKILNIDSCLSMWKIFKMQNSENSKDILEFIWNHFEKISLMQEFLNLEFSDIDELLGSKLDFVSDILVYKGVKNWINFNRSARENEIEKLLIHVKLECLPQDFLITDSKSFCDSNSSCLIKFINSMHSENKNKSGKCGSIDTLLAIGDYYLDTSKIIEIYDLSKKKWVDIEFNECYKKQFATVLVDDKLMIIGGDLVNTAEYYDLKTGKVESLPSMKYPRFLTSAVKFNDSVFVFGGLNNIFINHAERWDIKTNTWTDIGPMSTSRGGCGARVYKEEILLVGGRLSNNKETELVESYNPITNKWRTCTSMTEKRFGPAVAVIGEYFYAVGGYNETYLKTAERYDSQTQRWTLIESIEYRKWDLAGNVLNGEMVITGGDTGGIVDTVEKLEKDTGKWIKMASLNRPRRRHCLINIPWNLAELALARSNQS